MAAVCDDFAIIIFRYIASIHYDIALVTGIHSSEYIENCGFSGAGRAHNYNKLALFDVKTDMIRSSYDNFAHFIPFADFFKTYKTIQKNHPKTRKVCIMSKFVLIYMIINFLSDKLLLTALLFYLFVLYNQIVNKSINIYY